MLKTVKTIGNSVIVNSMNQFILLFIMTLVVFYSVHIDYHWHNLKIIIFLHRCKVWIKREQLGKWTLLSLFTVILLSQDHPNHLFVLLWSWLNTYLFWSFDKNKYAICLYVRHILWCSYRSYLKINTINSWIFMDKYKLFSKQIYVYCLKLFLKTQNNI